MTTRIRPRPFLLAAAALVAAAMFAAVGGATTAATAPTPTSAPAITGTLQVGQTLAANAGSWSGTTPITFAYQWERCDSAGNNCANISGETSTTYKVDVGDAGQTLRVKVTARNSAGTGVAESNHTNVVPSPTAPQNTAAPTISGTTTSGSTLTANNGTWTGTSPITYQYLWSRCDSVGGGCASISGATSQTYVLQSADVGHTLRVTVAASNSGGGSQTTSAPSAVVTAGTLANTAAPAVTGTAKEGQTLSVSNGTWTGASPITYTYAWQRCDTNGSNCSAIANATAQTYVLQSVDVGKSVRAVVTAKNGAGSSSANSNLLGPVASASTLPAGAVKLPSGAISVPASSVPDTSRLNIATVKFAPAAIHGRAPVALTVTVIDQNKYVISGALVYVLATPSSWAAKTAEVQTGQDGTAVVTVTPTAKAPKRGSLVLFVRARTPQGNVLAGSSTRRLIQVRIFAN